MCNNNRAEQAAAITKMYRERLERVATTCGLSTSSPLIAEWILDRLDNDNYHVMPERDLQESVALYYMVYRLSTFEYVDSSDLTHKLTYAQRARLLRAMRPDKDWTVEQFERALDNYVKQIKTKGVHSN